MCIHSAQMIEQSLLSVSDNLHQRSSHAVNLVDLHTLVAEHSDVSHGTVKQESLVEPIDKPVTRPVRYRDREHDQDREILARVKELDGDNDKLLVEYQQDIRHWHRVRTLQAGV